MMFCMIRLVVATDLANSHQLPGDKAEMSESGAMSGQRISRMEARCDDADVKRRRYGREV